MRRRKASATNYALPNWGAQPLIFAFPAASAGQQAEIGGLVEQILAARADAGADVSALEAQIDARVYALYGLDDGEIALIEGV